MISTGSIFITYSSECTDKLTDLLPVVSLQHFGQLLENSWVEDEQTAF